jgi:hypothetical protein
VNSVMFQCMYINLIYLVTVSCYEFDPGASSLRLCAIRSFVLKL